jgi:hypothetical protein
MNVACYHPSMHIIIYITLNMYSTEIQDFTNQYTTHQLHNLVLYVCVCVCVCVVSPFVLVESCCSILSFLCSVLFIIVCLFWHFDVDWSLYCLFFNLRLLIPSLYVQACLINVFYFSLLFQVLYPHPDDTPTPDKIYSWIMIAVIIIVYAILWMIIS